MVKLIQHMCVGLVFFIFLKNEVNTGVTNDINECSVLFRYKGLINVISNTCVCLLFQMKLAALKYTLLITVKLATVYHVAP